MGGCLVCFASPGYPWLDFKVSRGKLTSACLVSGSIHLAPTLAACFLGQLLRFWQKSYITWI